MSVVGCAIAGCPRKVKNRGLCRVHMRTEPRPTPLRGCGEPGCRKGAAGKRAFCRAHYEVRKLAGTIPRARQPKALGPKRRPGRAPGPDAKSCREPECPRSSRVRGLCTKCHARLKAANALPPKQSPGEALRLSTYRERARCIHSGCFFISRRGCRGWCKKHYEARKLEGPLPPTSRVGQGTKPIDVAGAKMSAQGWAEFFELSSKKVLYVQAAREGTSLVEEIQRRLREGPARKRAAYGSQVKPAPYEPANPLPPRPEPWPSAVLYARTRRELRRLVAYAPDLDELVQEVFSSIPMGCQATLVELVRIGREVKSTIYGGRPHGAVSWEAMAAADDGRHERVMADAVRRMGREENTPNPDDSDV